MINPEDLEKLAHLKRNSAKKEKKTEISFFEKKKVKAKLLNFCNSVVQIVEKHNSVKILVYNSKVNCVFCFRPSNLEEPSIVY
jgi:hypothetical protein